MEEGAFISADAEGGKGVREGREGGSERGKGGRE